MLTHRETPVVELAVADRTNREIADELHITVRTVGHHLRNVFGKLGVRTRAQLGRTAI